MPFWVAETSNLSLAINDQIPWLLSLTDGLRGLRDDGLPVRGLCWYSRGDQFDWQTELVNPKGAVTEVGLFDVHRRARPVACSLCATCLTGAVTSEPSLSPSAWPVLYSLLRLATKESGSPAAFSESRYHLWWVGDLAGSLVGCRQNSSTLGR